MRASIELAPEPDGAARQERSLSRRRTAAGELSRPPLATLTNGEIDAFEGAWPTSFTKGLPHDAFGCVAPDAFARFARAISEPDDDRTYRDLIGWLSAYFSAPRGSRPFRFQVPLGPNGAEASYRPSDYREETPAVGFVSKAAETAKGRVRGWESPRAGHVYDLEGPDAAAVAMAPAPKLGSDELAAEMADVYAMALLRDHSFKEIRGGGGDIQAVIDCLNDLPWFDLDAEPEDADGRRIGPVSRARRAARFRPDETKLSNQSLFRGSSFGCMDGPYISQFLLAGAASRETAEPPRRSTGYHTAGEIWLKRDGAADSLATPADGLIPYGVQRVDQRVQAHKKNLDHLTDWPTWLDAQNGADLRGQDAYEKALRFIATPRDLASFVHFDALYQAYLNACLLLLSIEAATDAGLPEGADSEVPTRSAFATFGGPHILTLVTEVATRALKAVRRQKFNHHLRARPEALGGVATLVAAGEAERLGRAQARAEAHLEKLRAAGADAALLAEVDKRNADQNAAAGRPAELPGGPSLAAGNYLLPMAFPEGSPMHPAYGAGHATVAGACVTMLKAFFEMFDGPDSWRPLSLAEIGRDRPITTVFEADRSGAELVAAPEGPQELTLIGELNKLAANISIGRNMAGVHYYSDYFDSLRMGERIALGILQEQMNTYPEPVQMRFLSFDDDRVTLRTSGADGGVELEIRDRDGLAAADWWTRNAPEDAGSGGWEWPWAWLWSPGSGVSWDWLFGDKPKKRPARRRRGGGGRRASR